MKPDDFDPDAPESHAAAGTAQAIASATARAAEGDTLPFPPHGLPALQSVPGRGMRGAAVLGYLVRLRTVRDCYGPDGRRRVPGDAGYLEAQHGRLRLAPMPKGWRFEERTAAVLCALVDGNPILLESQARAIGYARALATGPQWLELGEIDP
jgi:hypothetical protein